MIYLYSEKFDPLSKKHLKIIKTAINKLKPEDKFIVAIQNITDEIYITDANIRYNTVYNYMINTYHPFDHITKHWQVWNQYINTEEFINKNFQENVKLIH